MFASCLATTTFAATEFPLKLAYTFIPDLKGPIPTLHVQLTFAGNPGGTSTLILPTTWAGEIDLFKSVTNLRSAEQNIVVTATSDPGKFLVRYRPDQRVRITYDLVSDWTGELRHPKEFRPLVSQGDIIFNGQNGLVYPELAPESRIRASFTWKNLPSGWNVVSSFGTQTAQQKFNGEWHDVHNALFASSGFRFTRIQESGERLLLAARGTWVFPDSEAAEEIVNLFRVEREFWGERKQSSFLVVLTPYDQDLGSSDGTAFTNSFLLYLSKKQSFLTDEKSQLAHEVFHTWNPYRIGIPSGDDTEWFTEGFTRYYQDRILLHAGLVDYPQYLERLNRIIASYWSSPDRNWTQAEWVERKETHKAEYELPYSRGAMIALWVDQHIRKNSGGRSSLDERMLSLVRSKADVHLTTDYLLSALSQGMSSEDVAAFRSFVVDGVTIPLPPRLSLNCGNLVQPAGSNPYYSPSTTQCGVKLSSHTGR